MIRHIRVLVPSPDLQAAPDTDWARIPDHPDILASKEYISEVYPACPQGLEHARDKADDIRGRGGIREKANPVLCIGPPVPDKPFVTMRPINRVSDLLDFRAHSESPAPDESLEDLKRWKDTCEKTLKVLNNQAEDNEEKRKVVVYRLNEVQEMINDIESSLEALDAKWQSGKWPGESAMR